MANMEYIVYEKDLSKDIDKVSEKSFSGKSSIRTNRPIGFTVLVPIGNVKNAKAIQNDRLLKVKIRKVTDTTYNNLLNDLEKDFKNAEKREVAGVMPQSVLDSLWNAIQTKAERAGNKIGSQAVPVLGKYLKARNEGKAASFKFKYNRYKCALVVVGAGAGTSLAVVGVGAASAATMGAASAGLVLAVAGGAKAITGAYREYRRQTKSLEKTRDSIDRTITELKTKLSKQQKKEVGVTAREVLAKMSSEWFATNIESIKKLEQDTKLLEQLAQKRVLGASKLAAHAAEFHDSKKEAMKTLKPLVAELQISKKYFKRDPEISKLIPEMENQVGALTKFIKDSKIERDRITNDAAAMRREARNIIKVDVLKLRQTAADLKSHRHDIGWTAFPIKAIPAIASLAIGSVGAANPADTASETAEALAGLGVSIGESLQDTAKVLDKKFKILKKAMR